MAMGRLIDRIGSRVKLRDLNILLVVARTGSMGKAAAELGVSQPVISKAIAYLETELRIRLLDRGPQGVEPTVYGHALLKCGAAVLDELRQGVKTLEFLADPTVGELRLGCTEPLAAGFVATVLEQLSRMYPRVAFDVVTGDPLSLRDRELLERRVELIVTPTEALVPMSEIDAEALFDDRQVVVVGTKHRLATRRRVGLPELMQERWFLPPPDTIIGSQVADAFRRAGIEPPQPQIRSFSIPLCHRLVATGDFVTMLPISMVSLGSHRSLKLLRVEVLKVPRPTGILTVKNRTRSPLTEIFIDGARKLAAPLGEVPKFSTI